MTNVPQQYGLVRVLAVLLKVAAILILVLGVVGLVDSFSWGGRFALPQQLMTGAGIGTLVVALVTFVQLYAFGSILSLLVKIEENTRAMIQPPAEE